MAKLKSKHAEHDDIRNEIGVKKLHTTINNSKYGKKITNAGTIPIRRRGNEFELCVVTSRRCKGRFIFPKGKVIQNEKLKQTALRETIEEAGVSGELINYPIIHRVKGNWANGVCKTFCFFLTDFLIF